MCRESFALIAVTNVATLAFATLLVRCKLMSAKPVGWVPTGSSKVVRTQWYASEVVAGKAGARRGLKQVKPSGDRDGFAISSHI